jgi:hypothetical protein
MRNGKGHYSRSGMLLNREEPRFAVMDPSAKLAQRLTKVCTMSVFKMLGMPNQTRANNVPMK